MAEGMSEKRRFARELIEEYCSPFRPLERPLLGKGAMVPFDSGDTEMRLGLGGREDGWELNSCSTVRANQDV